ncbi:glutamate-cysteine ligase catalytic subunit [Neolentinus lepideus HHB14362 ss-1]|uniref:Glutamate--cysteine ligase n=1 Tax=Neolentinus lepideus HHB14362 ss-1 TaxID=1314782 RepID=A0A165V1I9_9AGAM|nr:glutamate-cysteine ligase catalytic subunit [Neolentinus lepideus HHB14362 ss-1]
MGLLSLGTPLAWDDAKRYAEHVREHGITQFLHIWDRMKDREGDELLWGDEIEYMVVSFDDTENNAKLSLRQTEILRKLASIVDGISSGLGDEVAVPTFHPEYGRYMLESTPGAPYTGSIQDVLSVENNMRYRRNLARKHLNAREIPMTFTSFPRLGVPGVFTEPHFDPSDAVSSHSLFLPEEITNPHARFPTLTANIRRRRGSKVAMNLPLFIDEHTPRPFVDPTIPWQRSRYSEDPEAKNGAALLDHIYMDAMGFGMGCCCLQLTFQSCNVKEARRMYDAMVPLAPIMLALTASSPLWRGYIADVDCRWNVIAGAVDDRTEEERGLKSLRENEKLIPKSRYDSVSLYISEDWINRPEYNDVLAPINEKVLQRLQDHGIDEALAKHISHLFIRDPLVIFSEMIDLDDTQSNDHFENIQSTNWQTVRFKPPPVNSAIGWRVEFRSMEVQLTDFENAAFAVFFVLLTRAILHFSLNLYVPISRVDENMQRAQKRDAVHSQHFYFRKNVFPLSASGSPVSPVLSGGVFPMEDVSNGINGHAHTKDKELKNCYPKMPQPDADIELEPVEEEYEEMTVNEIMNGKGVDFPGLLGLVYAYLETLDIDEKSRNKIEEYLSLIRGRSNGSLQTAATWIRNFVRNHSQYKYDSVVSQEINYDLMRSVDEIERGIRKAPGLLPESFVGSHHARVSLTSDS